MNAEEILHLSIRSSIRFLFVDLRLFAAGAADQKTYFIEIGDRRTPSSRRIDLKVADGVALHSYFNNACYTPPESAMGLDGTTYVLTMTRGFNELTVKWWVHVPDAWHGLDDAVKRLLDLAGVADLVSEEGPA